MQGQEYLDQISAENRPEKKSKLGSVLTSKFFLLGMGALVALIIIMIIGSALSGNKGGEKNVGYQLYLQLENTTEVIENYHDDVKSSDLRGYSSSLKSLLTTMSGELTNYLTAKYNFKKGNIDKKFVEEANTAKDELDSELFEAKINGILDRVFAHKMAYEISMMTAKEAKMIDATKSEEFKSVLENSYDSLMTLYEKFNSFSEGN